MTDKVRKNRIRKYIKEHVEPCTEIEESEGVVVVQSDIRVVTISCDVDGNVSENYRMRRGAGSKADYEKKVNNLAALKEYAKKHYRRYEYKGEDFDKSIVKVQNDDEVVTLSFDKKTIVEKKRSRPKKQTKDKGEEACRESRQAPKIKASEPVSEPQSEAKPKKHEVEVSREAEVKRETKIKSEAKPEKKNTRRTDDTEKFSVPKPDKNGRYHKTMLEENALVRNRYNGLTYNVVRDDDISIVVEDHTKTTFCMARADLEYPI